MLSTTQIEKRFGEAGDWSNFVKIELPYPMRIAWDLKKSISIMWCHKDAAKPFLSVFNSLLEKYGYCRLQELGIDLYGGCVNVRKMRGGSDWSRHSWGIALDLDPSRNTLRTKYKNAQFSKPEYDVMMDIFYENGFINLGREKGYDAMHFELM